jgi:acetyl coenzyme A synthetase (ADP forming)-like protein
MRELPQRSASLAPFFTPRGIALIGASRDPTKLSFAVLRNLLDPEAGFPGPVYPVNPHAREILGQICYPAVSDVPDPVDLAVLVIPAGAVPDAVEACGKRGIRAAVIISGGFREVGAEGAERERQIVSIARRYDMRLMGPNGIGVIDTHTPLNTTFVSGMPARGSISLLSQSGALCGGVIDWAVGRGIGFSRLLSVGNEADVNEADVLPCLADDERTRVITLYLEDVKDGPGFGAALRAATATKPVLAVKAGRTAGGQAATASHTGALASPHAAFRAACRHYGAIELERIEEMFDGALALAYQPLPQGKRIAILTNAGGPAALAADALSASDLTLAQTGAVAQAALRAVVLPDAQVAGPVDLLGGARPSEYRQALEIMLGDPNNDGVLAILVPQAVVDPAAVVEALAEAMRSAASGKPLLACLMGEASLGKARQAAHRHQIPAYTFPEQAVAAFGIMHRRARWLAFDHPLPTPPEGFDLQTAQALIAAADTGERQMLDAVTGQAILRASGIALPPDGLAASPGETAAIARAIGFPVVLKLIGAGIVHKTEAGGVLVGIRDEAAAREGFQTLLERAGTVALRGVQVQQQIANGREVIVGVKRDATFGPLVMFGMGGIYAEALADVGFRLAPLTARDAEEMIDEVRAAAILTGRRGTLPADRAAVVDALLRVSWLAQHCPEISELDLNPLLVLPDGEGALAVDVRVALR